MPRRRVSNTKNRPLPVRQIIPYLPGEQPKIKGLIKLNTNENPYPPSPRVMAAIKAGADARLRLYPNPTAEALRVKLSEFHGCQPENIIVGNGSDELLAMAVRAFVEPGACAQRNPAALSRAKVQFFEPSYSLYPALANIHGALKNPVALQPDFALPSLADLRRQERWDFRAALTFITTPNAPSGRGYSTAKLQTLCRAQQGLVVLDEAYVDFAEENAAGLALSEPNVIVSRTFSKAYSLCFQRVGYFIGDAELIGALQRIRDSYNVNGLGQLAALATLGDLPYYRRNFRKIISTRDELGRDLAGLGFRVLPSQTNFILVEPPRLAAAEWLAQLRQERVLVRWFDLPTVRQYLRITVGTAQQAEALVKAAKKILRASSGGVY